jgi:hypothetical protein
MVNLNYLQSQLRMAADCIGRGLDALASNPDAAVARQEITNVGTFDVPVVPAGAATSAYYSGLIDQLAKRLAVVEKQLFELNSRATQLTQIVLAIDPEACARHDLLPF